MPRMMKRTACMLSAVMLGALGGGARGMTNATATPKTPKKTHRPPQISTEMRAQLRRRIRPMPTAMPKTERHAIKAMTARVMFFTRGGSSGETPRVVPSKIPTKPRDVTRRVNKAARMATTAAKMTEAEADGLGEEGINSLYIISKRAAVATEVNVTRKNQGA